MCKLNKSAFTMIEVLCSVTLFSLMIVAASNIITVSYKLKLYNENLRKYVCYVEGLKNNITYNLKEEELSYIQQCGRNYIHKENMNMEDLKKKDLKEVLCKDIPEKEPYVHVIVEKAINSDKKYNIDIFLKVSDKKYIKCDFYKEF